MASESLAAILARRGPLSADVQRQPDVLLGR